MDEKGNLVTDKDGRNVLQFFVLKNLIMLGKFYEKNFLVQVKDFISAKFIWIYLQKLFKGLFSNT
jgi:hypothetical protein